MIFPTSGLNALGGFGASTGLLDGKSSFTFGRGPTPADLVEPGGGPLVVFTDGIFGVVIGAALGVGGGGSGDVGIAGALFGATSGATGFTGSIVFMEPAAGGGEDVPPARGLFVYPDSRFANFARFEISLIW